MAAKALLDLSAEAAKALAAKGPIVALESTIITHGMPYPQNFNTALMLDEAVRAQGATPATIAVHRRPLQGRARPRRAGVVSAAFRAASSRPRGAT